MSRGKRIEQAIELSEFVLKLSRAMKAHGEGIKILRHELRRILMVLKNHLYLPLLDPPLKRRDCGWHTVNQKNKGRKISMSKLLREKTDLIDFAFGKLRMRSFADLGGVWGVDGGYTFYALEKYKIEKAFLVDTNFTKAVEERKKTFPQLDLISGNFGSSEIPGKIGKVDTIFLFDVLLHQVAPDWDEVIGMYAKHTDSFIIYNQQYTGLKTVRLIDLGEEEYFKNAPHKREEEPYKSFIEKMYQMHPQHNRIYRDIHNVWQWGIVDRDLIDVLEKYGFERQYYRNHGQWGGLKNFEGHSFIFKK